MTRRFLTLVLLAALASGCAGTLNKPTTPAEQTAATQQALTDLQRFSSAADTALSGVNAAVKLEVEARNAFPGRITDDDHGKFLGYAERINDALTVALTEAKGAILEAKAQPGAFSITRRDVVRRLLELARSKLEDEPLPIADPALRRTLMASIGAVLFTLQVVLS